MDVRLVFHGSIALVRNRDNTVTMIVARFPHEEGLSDLVPHIKFPNGSLKTRPNDVVKAPETSGDRKFSHIKIQGGELLTLKLGAPAQPMTFDESTDPRSNTPVAKTRRSLKWLPHLGELNQDAALGVIDPKLLVLPQPQPPQQPANPPELTVAARIDLNQGHLRTTGIFDPVLVDFHETEKNPDGTLRVVGRPRVTRAVAREAELLFSVPGNELVIESDPITEERRVNRDTSRDLVFSGNAGQELVITIGNEPEDDIHQPIPQIHTDAENDKAVVAEFTQLYKLSAKKNLPTPLAPRVSGRRPSGNLCVVPIYNSGT
jgi:hypothetical protein